MKVGRVLYIGETGQKTGLDVEVAMIQFYQPLYNDKYSFSRPVDHDEDDLA